MKNILIGNVAVPTQDYAISGTALLGVRGTGKTTLAKAIAEQLMDQGIPIIAFDPIGVWRYLKVPAGNDGRGYPVVVAGGAEPDLALTPQTAPEIVRAAMRENVSLVIDLYDTKLSKGDWKKIVQGCFRTLLYENKGVRHIFLEEAGEFAPQRVSATDGETYAAVEKLVRMGGNYSLGITLINQRAQEVNKAVLDLCETLVLMRQTGSHAIDALEKWIDRLAPQYAKKITEEMPGMLAGNAWVFASGAEVPKYTRGQALHTFHPDRKHPSLVTLPAADASAFVVAMKNALPEIVKQQEENDPAYLRTEIAKLRRQLDGKAPMVDVQALKDRAARDGKVIEALRAALDSARGEISIAMSALAGAQGAMTVEEEPPPPPAARPSKYRGTPDREPTFGLARDKPEGGIVLSGTATKCLKAIAQHPEGVSHSMLCALSGLAARTVLNQATVLRSLKYIYNGPNYRATPAGIAALGSDYEPLPTGRALYDYWLGKISGTAKSVLAVIYKHGAFGAARAEIEAATSLAPRTVRNQLTELKRRRLVYQDGERLYAAPSLFD